MSFPRSRDAALAVVLAALLGGCALDRSAFGAERDAAVDAPSDAGVDSGSVDAGPPGPLLHGEGSYMRGSEASFEDRAGVVRFVAPHARRIDDTRDGMTLVEGARTNLVRQSQALGAAAWSHDPSCTLRDDDAVAPDGSSTADRALAPLGERCTHQTSQREAVRHTLSAWFRSDLPGPLRASGAREVAIRATSSTGWARLRATGLVAAPRFDDVALDGRAGHPASSDVAIAHDVLTWGWQLEAARFASSYIRTGADTATRPADTWVFAPSDVDPRLASGPWSVSVEPGWTRSELDGVAWVISFSPSSGLRFRRTGPMVIEAVVDGIPVAAVAVPDLQRGNALRIDVHPSAGRLVLTHEGSAVETSVSPWSWAIEGDVRIGGRVGGEEELFGWVSVPSTP